MQRIRRSWSIPRWIQERSGLDLDCSGTGEEKKVEERAQVLLEESKKRRKRMEAETAPGDHQPPLPKCCGLTYIISCNISHI